MIERTERPKCLKSELNFVWFSNRNVRISDIYCIYINYSFKFSEIYFPDPMYRLCYASSMEEVLDIVESLGDHVSPMQSSQALSTLFHMQKFAAYVVDYLDETDHLECRAEFNRTLKEQERYVRLVEIVSCFSLL